MSLSKIARRLLSPDIHALVEAGFLTDDLQTTEKGRLALTHILFEDNHEKIVAAAKEVVAKNKEDEAKRK